MPQRRQQRNRCCQSTNILPASNNVPTSSPFIPGPQRKGLQQGQGMGRGKGCRGLMGQGSMGRGRRAMGRQGIGNWGPNDIAGQS